MQDGFRQAYCSMLYTFQRLIMLPLSAKVCVQGDYVNGGKKLDIDYLPRHSKCQKVDTVPIGFKVEKIHSKKGNIYDTTNLTL